MIYLRSLLLVTAVAVISTACGSAASNASANSSNAGKANVSNTTAANTAAPAAAAPTMDSIAALEKTGWEAWKNHDGKVPAELLSEKYVGFNAAGRTNKAMSVESMAKTNCNVNSYSWSDQKMRMLGSDVAVLTFKADQDYTCDGKKGDTPTESASVYVREGDKWKNVFYAETKVVAANAQPPKAKTGETKAPDAKPDDLTTALMAVETKAWDAWKNRDVKGVEDVMAKDFAYLSGKGLLERADSIKGWSDPKCTGLGYTFLEPMGIQL